MDRRNVAFSNNNSSNNGFAVSAAKTLDALPLLVNADEAIRILTQLSPQQKIWLALERVGLPASATGNRQLQAPSHQQQQQQQQQQLYQRAPTSEYVDATTLASATQRAGSAVPQPSSRYREEEEAVEFMEIESRRRQQEHEYQQQKQRASLRQQQQQEQADAVRVGAISPPRPVVRTAAGPRDYDKTLSLQHQQAQEQQLLAEERQARDPWNASPKPRRDDRGCFPPSHVSSAIDDEQLLQQRFRDEVGLVDHEVVSRVIRSPHRRAAAEMTDANGGDGNVRVFRFDPRAFESGNSNCSEIVETPPSRRISPPRRATAAREQPNSSSSSSSGGLLLDRLRETVHQNRQPQHYQQQPNPNHYHDPNLPQFVVDEPRATTSRRGASSGGASGGSSTNGGNSFFVSIPSRTLGQSKAPVHSMDQPAVPVHLNRSLLLRRDSARKKNHIIEKQQLLNQCGGGGGGGGISPGRSTANSRAFQHIRATVQRPPAAKDIVAPTRPGGTGAFFLSTAQHFPAVSPSRDRHYSHGRSGRDAVAPGSPQHEDRRGRRGVAWVV